MSELKACPFCGSEAARIELDGGFAWGECMKCGATSKVVLFITDTNDVRIAAAVKYWNARPIEDALLARAEKAEDIIHGMFPLWVAAMSYAEHGRAADLDRIRNYYNGRNNPLTSEQLYYLFSMEDKK